jgi:AcrR family transcriptional regulator
MPVFGGGKGQAEYRFAVGLVVGERRVGVRAVLPKAFLHFSDRIARSNVSLTPASPQTDGRRLRTERTRRAIIEAYLQLLNRSSAIPTASQIAEQAGCSVRSIFERFSSLDALSIATADHAIAQAQAESVARNVDGDRATRIRSHVETRALACEKWLPLWRVLVNLDKPDLKQRVAMVRHANIERMKLMYEPELSQLPTSKRDDLLIALATLVSFESWDQLRNCYNLSADASQTLWRSVIDLVLPAIQTTAPAHPGL